MALGSDAEEPGPEAYAKEPKDGQISVPPPKKKLFYVKSATGFGYEVVTAGTKRNTLFVECKAV